jgi:hypothetical protein
VNTSLASTVVADVRFDARRIAIVYDWRTRGRPHKVYLCGLVAVLLSSVLPVLIAATQAWMSMARHLQSLGG